MPQSGRVGGTNAEDSKDRSRREARNDVFRAKIDRISLGKFQNTTMTVEC
jgi:hypothetical protein